MEGCTGGMKGCIADMADMEGCRADIEDLVARLSSTVTFAAAITNYEHQTFD